MDHDWLRRRARELRNDSTYAERVLWQALRRRQFGGLKFRRQRRVDRFVVDFACVELRLAVELDGGVHEERALEDLDRTREIEKAGWHVLRVPNGLVVNRVEEAVRLIAAEIALITR